MARPRTLIQFTAPGFDRTGSLPAGSRKLEKMDGRKDGKCVS